MPRVIFVLGGVVSSLGKGIITASIAALLKSQGYRILVKKIDPYLNVDPGTLSPYEHGEVFVTKDGGETDLDLGHYERFTGLELTKESSVSTGQIYKEVISKERRGDYGGKTVQIVPHITNEIKRRFLETNGQEYDFVIIELGGTVGDLESQIYVEVIRQMKFSLDGLKPMIFHTALLPKLSITNEIKTKPVQHTIKELHAAGVHPDALVLRFTDNLKKESKELKKISVLTGVKLDNIFMSYDVEDLYYIPKILFDQGIISAISSFFNLKQRDVHLEKTEEYHKKSVKKRRKIVISLVGKYINYPDCYISIIESLKISSVYLNLDVHINWVDSSLLTNNNINKILKPSNGILIAPGFGERGFNGKILAAKYARVNKIPCLGICLGMQVTIIEILRNVGKLNVTSLEMSKDTKKMNAIDVIQGKEEEKGIGGTLRLGNYECYLEKGTKIRKIYQEETILERHRHRYEVNGDYAEDLKRCGVVISGINKKLNLIETIELKDHPFYIACQYHPEYKSSILKPHPLFDSFLKIAKTRIIK